MSQTLFDVLRHSIDTCSFHNYSLLIFEISQKEKLHLVCLIEWQVSTVGLSLNIAKILHAITYKVISHKSSLNYKSKFKRQNT